MDKRMQSCAFLKIFIIFSVYVSGSILNETENQSDSTNVTLTSDKFLSIAPSKPTQITNGISFGLTRSLHELAKSTGLLEETSKYQIIFNNSEIFTEISNIRSRSISSNSTGDGGHVDNNNSNITPTTAMISKAKPLHKPEIIFNEEKEKSNIKQNYKTTKLSTVSMTPPFMTIFAPLTQTINTSAITHTVETATKSLLNLNEDSEVKEINLDFTLLETTSEMSLSLMTASSSTPPPPPPPSPLPSSVSTLLEDVSTHFPVRSYSTRKPPIVDKYQNITSQAGTHAYLPCNVKHLVKKPISWLRVRDGHILTVDQTTFIADQRFQSIYTSNPERWSLQIKYVQPKDAGTYECQVSTEPKSSAIVSLNIVKANTELLGDSNRHVKAGSQVTLRCIISQALEPPLFVNWFYNNKQIYLHNRKGWRTEIERLDETNPTLSQGEHTSSRSGLKQSQASMSSANDVNDGSEIRYTTAASLIIPSVEKHDSGNYTCSPSNSEPMTVVLHVLSGEFSASAITSGMRSTVLDGNNNNDSRWQSNKIAIVVLLWIVRFLLPIKISKKKIIRKLKNTKIAINSSG